METETMRHLLLRANMTFQIKSMQMQTIQDTIKFVKNVVQRYLKNTIMVLFKSLQAEKIRKIITIINVTIVDI